MSEPRSRIDVWSSRIRNHPVVAPLLVLGTVVIALSTFTDAARNLFDLAWPKTRPEINGAWRATVVYDWSSRPYPETFRFAGEGAEVHGTASFLGVRRGIVEGTVEGDTLQFITTTREELGPEESTQAVHRYRGNIRGDEIEFLMQTEGGYSEHPPIEFTATKAPTRPKR